MTYVTRPPLHTFPTHSHAKEAAEMIAGAYALGIIEDWAYEEDHKNPLFRLMVPGDDEMVLGLTIREAIAFGKGVLATLRRYAL